MLHLRERTVSERVPPHSKGVIMRMHVCDTGSEPVRWGRVTSPTWEGLKFTLGGSLGGMGASHQDTDVSHESGVK